MPRSQVKIAGLGLLVATSVPIWAHAAPLTPPEVSITLAFGNTIQTTYPDGRTQEIWLRPDGTQMQPEDWDSGFGRAIGVFLNGDGIRERDARGRAIRDRHFIVLFNAGDEAIDFTIPKVHASPSWDLLVETGAHGNGEHPVEPGGTVTLQARALAVLGAHSDEETDVGHSAAASVAQATDGASPAR